MKSFEFKMMKAKRGFAKQKNETINELRSLEYELIHLIIAKACGASAPERVEVERKIKELHVLLEDICSDVKNKSKFKG